jgi:hypothetical protein
VHPLGVMIVEAIGLRCQKCGKSLTAHQRCAACQILIGPGHHETTSIDGLCHACHDYLDRRAERGMSTSTILEDLDD